MSELTAYNARESYRWNYDHAPDVPNVEVPRVSGRWTFCGLEVDSPLGIAAGPLLNGRWVLYYAALGFDVLTYKTVRSSARECYPLPNLVPVDAALMRGGEDRVSEAATMDGSWAVSFGMPSAAPDVWREDIERTRSQLPSGKLLSVSVVGTVQDGWTIDDLANDYARCALWAVEAGADCVETNFSCPNVSTCDGQLYQQPEAAAQVAACVREVIGGTPYLAKIGHVAEAGEAAALLTALGPYVSGLAMTNSVATRVLGLGGGLLFDGERRGICGAATREASLAQLKLFAEESKRLKLDPALIAVGGASTAEHVRSYLAAGAESVQIATAAMVRPDVALVIRRGLVGSG